MITKKWRTMMLKNHPDTGGSPFVAAKINEAKEIVLGEKPAKEGSEEDDEDGSSDLDHADETPEETMKRKQKEWAAKQDNLDVTSEEPEAPHPDTGPMSQHPAPPYYKWERVNPSVNQEQASPRSNYFYKEDIFHRKATRTKPHFKPYDDPNLWPEEAWRSKFTSEYLKSIEEEKRKKAEGLTWVEDPVPTGLQPDINVKYGHYENAEGVTVDPQDEYFENQDIAKRARTFNAKRSAIFQADIESSVERVRRMSEIQARERLKKKRSQL